MKPRKKGVEFNSLNRMPKGLLPSDARPNGFIRTGNELNRITIAGNIKN